jgi:thioredoxin reductase
MDLSPAYDVIVVGAGPAGLSAALMLGRCRRRVLVCDAGRPRNAASRALHGFLSRDGIAPLELLRIGREELRQYDTVELREAVAVDAACVDGRFQVTLEGGERHAARKLLLATGVMDHVPDIEGLAPLYGRSVFHCPYCDAWEVRDRALAVYGRGAPALGLALELTLWSRDIILCTDGPAGIDRAGLDRLARNAVVVREERVARLAGTDGRLEQVVFESGEAIARQALFFTTAQTQRSHLAVAMGCEFNDKGIVRTGPYETTRMRGLYVAGDASRAVQWAIVAAAEGAEAAFAINTDLLKEDLR